MHSDAHRKLPEREEKINHLIHENRFDIFDWLCPCIFLAGPLWFLINFAILSVRFRFLTTTLQRQSIHLSGVKKNWNRQQARGALSRVLTLHRGSRLVGLGTPFHHCTREETKTSKLKASAQSPNSYQLAGRGNNQTMEPIVRPPSPTSPSPNLQLYLDRPGPLSLLWPRFSQIKICH